MLYNKGKEIPNDIIDYIKKYFAYDPQTGKITRSDRKNSCGSLCHDGYLILKIKGKQYKAHRIAWLLYYGRPPVMEIDHINRIKTDNRIINLKEATRYDNIMNRDLKPNEKTGVVGVYLDQCTNGLKKKYALHRNGKTYRFYTLEDAINFRLSNNLNI